MASDSESLQPSSSDSSEGEATCYAQGERMVRLGAFECEGGSSDAYLATAVSGEGWG